MIECAFFGQEKNTVDARNVALWSEFHGNYTLHGTLNNFLIYTIVQPPPNDMVIFGDFI